MIGRVRWRMMRRPFLHNSVLQCHPHIDLNIFEHSYFFKSWNSHNDWPTNSSTHQLKKCTPTLAKVERTKVKLYQSEDYDLAKTELDQCRSRPSSLDLEHVVINLFLVSSSHPFFLFPFSFPFVCPCRSARPASSQHRISTTIFPISNKMFDIIFISLEVFVFMFVKFCNKNPFNFSIVLNIINIFDFFPPITNFSFVF